MKRTTAQICSVASLVLAAVLCALPVFGEPYWIEYKKGFSYDKNSLRKVKGNVYQATALAAGEKGYATMKVRVDCATKDLLYGTVTMYDKNGNFLFSDGAKGYKGGQATGKADQELVEAICAGK